MENVVPCLIKICIVFTDLIHFDYANLLEHLNESLDAFQA